MTLASPSDFAAAHHAAYQAVGRVLGRVTGSRAIEAVRDGFVVAVEVEGYAEPFEVAAGYEKRRGWVAELRDGTGRVWAVGAGARLPEAVASMGRAGNPPLGGGDERLRRLERAVRADPSDDRARHALLAAQARLGDPMAGARISAIERLGPDADAEAIDAETARIVRTMTEAVWRRVPRRTKVGIIQAIIDREFRRAGLGGREFDGIRPRAMIADSKIRLFDYSGHFEDWKRSETPASWSVKAREWAANWASQLSQEARAEEQQRRWEAAEADRQWRESQDDLYPNPPSPPRWSSRGPATRKIYAKGPIPRTTRTSPHLKKLYNGLLKHYTKRVAETKRGRTWDEVAAILKIRPKGRASVALWGRALAERVFYAKLRGLAFSKDMIRKLPREGM